jgi:hypothetical protein
VRKKILVSLFSLACLALAVGVLMTVGTPTTTAAPDPSIMVAGLCPFEPECPGSTPDKPKAEVCHYDKGKPEGHINCQNASSIVSHIGDGGHDRDYCAADTDRVCANIEPSPSPTPVPQP